MPAIPTLPLKLLAAVIGGICLLLVLLDVERNVAVRVFWIAAFAMLVLQLIVVGWDSKDRKWRGLQVTEGIYIPPLVQYVGTIVVVILVLFVIDLAT